jgi:hypothetical protein
MLSRGLSFLSNKTCCILNVKKTQTNLLSLFRKLYNAKTGIAIMRIRAKIRRLTQTADQGNRSRFDAKIKLTASKEEPVLTIEK